MVHIKEDSLLERLGGVSAIRLVIDEFYDRILADPKLAHFFDGIRMSALKLHQVRFFRVAFTEIPPDLDVTAMLIEKHRSLFENKGLDASHFDLVAGHLVATLKNIGVAESLIEETISVVAPLRAVFEEGVKGAPVPKAPSNVSADNSKKSKKPNRFLNVFRRKSVAI